ncbi:Aminotransferase, class I/classII [Kalmanozyma brasiliensis GHG001]|uniref:Aminotransferase class I/classII large domain-containing protein n=1 Tax=Kalmanozyma brasiliensis (strain GHG001) TaxID=1365824 RepID=V5GNQ5_KALBG|nr:Aminotransferase, class I/classII [Kalmanozyma brasiliensis GHG001]EST07582.1 Aminotransferase, class I/classII [Kalmanozyma brasiliensis GHG001]
MSFSTGPSYDFNPFLHILTIDPPVQIGAKWAQSYPSSSSPLVAAGVLSEFPLLNLAQGVPGDPPTAALLERIQFESRPENASSPAGHSHGYGPVFGDPKLRQAVARDINRVYRTPGKGDRNQITEDNVGITAGCNLAFTAVATSIAAPGDALIICDPWYFNHQMTMTAFGIQVAAVHTKPPDYFPDVQMIRALLASDSRASVKTIKGVVLVTPNNPTGAIYPPELIRNVAVLCKEYRVALILDETYRDFLLTGNDLNDPSKPSASAPTPALPHDFARPHDLFEDAPPGLAESSWDSNWDWRSTIIQLFSFSKSYAIPGHRLGGFVAHSAFLQQKIKDASGADKLVFGPTAKALDNFQVAPPRTDTQRAVAWAMEDPQQLAWRASVANELRVRRRAFIEALSEPVPPFFGQDASQAKSPEQWGWHVESAGAYYVFLRHPFTTVPSDKVAQALAELVGVVVLPGAFFMPADADATSPESSGSRLRVSIANVATEKLSSLPTRLAILSELWEERGAGWGVAAQ